MAHGAVNGMWGDLLAERHPELALTMCLRVNGRDVAVSPPAIRAAYPEATGRIAVFVHGWCDSAESWQRHALQRIAAASSPLETVDYGEALRRDLGYTPVYVRYNTGLHISDNGRALAELLDVLYAAWPVPVESLALIGHSMGGLVARSACHAGNSSAWARELRHVICLGSPHLGAPLEKGVNALSWALARVPETRGVARLINLRSRGVKDLRFGSCAEVDWQGIDPDEFLRDRCSEVPFLPNATYCFVGATLSTTPDSVVGRLIGDVLVLYPSAAGRGRRRRIPFAEERGRHFGGMHHLQLLNSPRVYPLLRDWLGEPG
jgi:pimeloyl-ACP methyl ester carboxylesterase